MSTDIKELLTKIAQNQEHIQHQQELLYATMTREFSRIQSEINQLFELQKLIWLSDLTDSLDTALKSEVNESVPASGNITVDATDAFTKITAAAQNYKFDEMEKAAASLMARYLRMPPVRQP